MCTNLICFKLISCPLIYIKVQSFHFWIVSIDSNFLLKTFQSKNKDTKLLNFEVNTKCNEDYIEHKVIYFSSNLLQDI